MSQKTANNAFTKLILLKVFVQPNFRINKSKAVVITAKLNPVCSLK